MPGCSRQSTDMFQELLAAQMRGSNVPSDKDTAARAPDLPARHRHDEMVSQMWLLIRRN
jgi:hypothetical protein